MQVSIPLSRWRCRRDLRCAAYLTHCTLVAVKGSPAPVIRPRSLGRGAVVRGRVLGTTRLPPLIRTVHFVLIEGHDRWTLWSAPIDDDGRYEIAGVLPHATLESTFGVETTRFSTGARGSVTTVDLTWD